MTAEVDFLDPVVNQCPYGVYATLLDEAPVIFDKRTNMYVLTRYEDIREVLNNPELYSNMAGRTRRDRTDPKVMELYEKHGWVPAPSLGILDDPTHKELRSVFIHAFRAKRIRQLEDEIRETSHALIDRFIERGECDWVSEFAAMLPLHIIVGQMGVPEEDLPKIKKWIDSFCKRLTWSQSEEEVLESVRDEIEGQQYFQPRFEKLRREPQDNFMSDLVNTVIPNWDRTLNDNELHAEMMADTFGGGGETSHGAIAHAMQFLIQYPDIQAELRENPDKIPAFVEEVLRLESPVQGLFRSNTEDVEWHGVKIPEGSVINVRFAAANRDERQFECPEEFRIDRANGRKHVAFGGGIHTCPGATLARAEIRIAVEIVLQRTSRLWFVDESAPLDHQFSYVLHALSSLPIGFEKA